MSLGEGLRFLLDYLLIDSSGVIIPHLSLVVSSPKTVWVY